MEDEAYLFPTFITRWIWSYAADVCFDYLPYSLSFQIELNIKFTWNKIKKNSFYKMWYTTNGGVDKADITFLYNNTLLKS